MDWHLPRNASASELEIQADTLREVVLSPGRSVRRALDGDASARALAVVAVFRRPAGLSWRARPPPGRCRRPARLARRQLQPWQARPLPIRACCAWAGSQRYPLHWGGDAENTNSAMAAELTMA